MRVRKAVIPVAGLGTRFLPATKAQPKEMLPVVDKPTLQYIVEEAVHSGIEEILFVTGRGKGTIEDHFDRSPELEGILEKSGKTEPLEMVQNIANLADIHYIRQKEPKGLGHAVHCAKHFVGDEPFAVLLGDDVVYNEETPALAQLIQVYTKKNRSVLGVQEVAAEDVSKYGIVQGQMQEDGTVLVQSMIEKPSLEQAPSRIAVLGRYILTPAIMDILAETKPGAGNEIQLTDAILTLAKQEDVFAKTYTGRRYDVGSKLGFLEATVEYALRDPQLKEGFRAYLNRLLSRE